MVRQIRGFEIDLSYGGYVDERMSLCRSVETGLKQRSAPKNTFWKTAFLYRGNQNPKDYSAHIMKSYEGRLMSPITVELEPTRCGGTFIATEIC